MGLNVIDISSNQGDINLVGLSPAPDGVIIKASQGNSYTNPYFSGQAGQMQQKGILAGAYHYLDGSGWKAEADHFVSVMKNYQGWHLWFADWENNPGGGENPEFVAGNTGYLKSFMDEVTNQLGYRGGVYASISPIRSQDFSAIAQAGYTLWFAQYADTDPTGWQTDPWYDGQGYGPFQKSKVIGQQYTANLRLTGYNGPLDGSLFDATADDWKNGATGGTDDSTINNVTKPATPKVDKDPCLGLGLAGMMATMKHTYVPRKGLRG